MESYDFSKSLIAGISQIQQNTKFLLCHLQDATVCQTSCRGTNKEHSSQGYMSKLPKGPLLVLFCFEHQIFFCSPYLRLFCVSVLNKTCLELGDKGLHFIPINVVLRQFCSVLVGSLGPNSKIQVIYNLSCNIISHTIQIKH